MCPKTEPTNAFLPQKTILRSIRVGNVLKESASESTPYVLILQLELLPFSRRSDGYSFFCHQSFFTGQLNKSNQRMKIACVCYNRSSKMEYNLLLNRMGKWKQQQQGQRCCRASIRSSLL